jgi:hypothetical protein
MERGRTFGGGGEQQDRIRHDVMNMSVKVNVVFIFLDPSWNPSHAAVGLKFVRCPS